MSLRTVLQGLLGTAWRENGNEIIDALSVAVDGTAEASKALVLDANKDATGLRNLTITGTLVAAGVTGPDAAAELTALSALTSADFGKTFYINNATGFATTLPAPALGGKLTFINKTANTSGNHTLVTAGSANIIKGNQNSVAGDAGDTGTSDDTINFVANQSLPGDRVELESDGTSWFAYATSRVAAGITFTTAS